MTRVLQTKTSFVAGELDPVLYGRLDLRAREEGAAKLQNVVVLPTGGVRRRPGTRLVTKLDAGERLIDFDDGVTRALLVLSASTIEIFENGTKVETFEGLPWDEDQIAELAWAQQRNWLVLVHPQKPPRILTKTPTGWSIETGLPWEREEQGAPPLQPFARHADNTVELELQRTDGSTINGSASGEVDIVASADIFDVPYQGTWLKFRGIDIEITDYISSSRVRGTLSATVAEARATRDWQEQAFSEVRGWPRTIGFHQNRLVIGGGRDFPDYVWMSSSGRFFNFDLGEGLDDEAIIFRLKSDRVDIVRALFPGRRLQIFTNTGEWVVTGNPVTPQSVAVDLQTRVGSYEQRRLDPIDVDGATLFVGAGGRDLREFLYSDSEQAYQAADLALLSRHLMREPRALCFDGRNRLLMIVREDGDAALVSIDRNSNVIAWSRMTIAGSIIGCAVHQGAIHILTRQNKQTWIERLDPDALLDRSIKQVRDTAVALWFGFDAQLGLNVSLLGDDQDLGETLVDDHLIETSVAVSTLEVGVPFEHEIEPLPTIAGGNRGVAQDQLYRPIRFSFRLHQTDELRVDPGNGFRLAAITPGVGEPFSGDVRLSAMGWRRPSMTPSWRIRQSTPKPFCLLSVTMEMKVNS